MTPTYPVVCFGEVLWDLLPGKALPGGAPMNVAYHLKKLGTNPALITMIGTDNYGKRLIDLLAESGLTTEYFQVDYDHPTGLVYAKANEHNEVVYDIVFPSAWDFIQWQDEFTDLMAESRFFVFGSLTSRNKVSRETLHQLLELAKTKVLDINLRPPNYHRSQIEFLLGKTDILKVNLAELELITGWFSHFTNTEDRTRLLQDQFRIETIIVTKGGDGALVNDKGTIYQHTGYKVQVADTIGSGDAFLAGFLHQLISNSSAQQALEFASGLGAFIATQSGACPAYETTEVTALMNAGEHQKEHISL
ncbi:MAG: carbohydrate kinase [Flavisolibacter sp.]|nr:carbohydrate kinase [Flavisolibacter sp.]